VHNLPSDLRDPTGLYTLTGFLPDRTQEMRDAIKSAIDKLKAGGCNGCAGPNGPKIIQKLQSATHIYDENYMENGLAVCGSSNPLTSNRITITHRAFHQFRCGSLASTLAHEAMHKALQSEDELLIKDMEKKCF
jgi:hypothetical protein